jgi:hypothetical protein
VLVGNHTLLWTHKVTAKNVAWCTAELTDYCIGVNRDKTSNHQYQPESELMKLGTDATGSPFLFCAVTMK